MDEQMSRQAHPCICIPSILNEILSYSTCLDLKSHRFVCKQWNDEACKLLRSKIRATFDNYRRIKTYSLRMQDRKDFCPSFKIGNNISLLAPVTIQFFTDFGPFIRSLELKTHQFELTALKKLLYELLPNLEEFSMDSVLIFMRGLFTKEGENILDNSIQTLPKMKQLKLNLEYFNHEGPPMLTRELLRAMPNLEVVSSLKKEQPESTTMTLQDIIFITHQYIENGMDDFLDELINQTPICDYNICSAILNDNGIRLEKLQRLDVYLRLADEHVQKLGAKKFPLRHLELELHANVKLTTLQTLLNSLKRSLKSLKLIYHNRARHSNEFPSGLEMEFLRSVHLQGFQGSLKFVEYMPQLKSLILSKIHTTRAVLGENFEFEKPHELQTLHIFDDACRYCSPLAVHKMARLFPKLTNLRLEKLTDDSLRLVYSGWPQLEELAIVSGLFTDTGTSGIHPNAYRVILREESYDYINPEALREAPYIGNLKKLRRLEISSPKITDISIILGVVNCHNLRKLSILSYGITDKSLLRIVDKMNLVQLKTEFCNQLTIPTVKYAMEKLQGQELSINEYNGPIKRNQIPDFLRKNRNARVTLPRVPY